MKLIQTFSLLLMVSTLASCSLFSPVKTEQSTTYVLSSVPVYFPEHHAHKGTILVMTPDTAPLFNTTQMAYTNKLYAVSYFSQNQWAETPSQMLQPLLMQALHNTHVFRNVAMAPYTGKYDYALSTQILTLQQNFMHRPSLLQFFVRAQLINASTSEVISTKEFYIYEPIWVKSPYGGVIAANQATAKLLRQIAEFCVKKA